MQPHWVGDLSLQANLEIQNAGSSAAVRLELIKAGIPYRCTIDLGTGTATITRGQEVLGRFPTALKGAGRDRVEFAHLDHRGTLMGHGRTEGGGGFEYNS